VCWRTAVFVGTAKNIFPVVKNGYRWSLLVQYSLWSQIGKYKELSKLNHDIEALFSGRHQGSGNSTEHHTGNQVRQST
jgi:hypothetical protein